MPHTRPAPAASTPAEPLLPRIKSPADLKALPLEDLPRLAAEIRQEIIEVTSRNGGHVGPNLGVVDLTIALHRVFDTPADHFLFDVSHQAYTHKLLTGRGGEFFRRLRQDGGASGFLDRDESPHDCFGAGHAGTALSAAVGLAAARDLSGGTEHVIAVCGDAAFTCGITMEALNNACSATRRLIVILNDNEWSISRNVGAMARYLNELSTSRAYNRIHHDLEQFFRSLPGGDSMHQLWLKWKRETKDFIVGSSLFEKFGLRYLGPIDGHDIPLLIKNLEFARTADQPVVLHVLTQKGRGLDAALEHPEKFHGASPYDPLTGQSRPAPNGNPPCWQDAFGEALLRMARQDPRIVAVTAAMSSGTGLSTLARELPKQFFDVGIAEEHAVIFAAGLAVRGLRPVVAIYSTFMQRGYDPVIHDVCLQNLPVVFCIDRAGLSPHDGPTHHGLFDIAFLRCVPNAVIMQPRDGGELADMLHGALQRKGPSFIRYPRGGAPGATPKAASASIEIGRAEVLRKGADLSIWALGPMVEEALAAAEGLQAAGVSAAVVNARFVKPLDADLLVEHASTGLIVTMEDHVIQGGFGSAVIEALQDARRHVPVERIGWPDSFIAHGSSTASLRAAHGLDRQSLLQRILARHRSLHPVPYTTNPPS